MCRCKKLLLTITLFGLSLSPVCADELLSLKAGYLQLNPDGEFAVTAGDLIGTTVDMDDDLNFEDSEDLYLEAGLQLGSFRLFASYIPVGFSGDGVLTEDVNFNGETFVAGSHVESDVDLDIYEAGLAWYLINLDDTPVRLQLGPELAVKYVDASVDMQEDLAGISESESIGVPVPTVGLRARVAFADMLGVVARVGYLEYDDNSFLDVDAQLEFSPVPLVGLFAGYRYLDVDVEEDDVIIDATFDGPYAGVLVRF